MRSGAGSEWRRVWRGADAGDEQHRVGGERAARARGEWGRVEGKGGVKCGVGGEGEDEGEGEGGEGEEGGGGEGGEGVGRGGMNE